MNLISFSLSFEIRGAVQVKCAVKRRAKKASLRFLGEEGAAPRIIAGVGSSSSPPFDFYDNSFEDSVCTTMLQNNITQALNFMGPRPCFHEDEQLASHPFEHQRRFFLGK